MILVKLLILSSCILTVSGSTKSDLVGHKRSVLLEFVGAPENKQFAIEGDVLVLTNDTHYAVAEELFLFANIQTISVNGQQVTMYSPSCEVTTKTIDEMSPEEQNLLVTAKGRLTGGATNSMTFENDERVKVNLVYFKNSCTNGCLYKDQHKMSVVKLSDQSYSTEGRRMRDNLARVFVHHNAVAFVYMDGTILMKPMLCLSPGELDLRRREKSES